MLMSRTRVTAAVAIVTGGVVGVVFAWAVVLEILRGLVSGQANVLRIWEGRLVESDVGTLDDDVLRTDVDREEVVVGTEANEYTAMGA